MEHDNMRSARQSKILDIISKQEIETQEDLSAALKRAGISVTQATISRDIKELGLIKVLSDNKKYKYAIVDMGEQKISNKFLNLFRESVVSIASSENLIVIKTISGSANAAAMAIDKLGFKEMLGCVAGDDTLLIVVTSKEAVEGVLSKISKLI